MRARREHIDPGGESSFRCRHDRVSGWPFQWHFHPELELTLIVRGRGQRFVGDDIADFRDGDLVLLGENLPHTWQSRASSKKAASEAVVVQFLPTCFGDGLFDRPETRHIGRLLRQAAAGIHFRGRAAGAAAERMLRIGDLPPLRRLTALLEILDGLAACRSTRTLATPRFRPSSRPSDQRRIHRTLQFVHERFTTDVTLKQAAALARLSDSAFSRFFQRATGKRFARYVNELRVGRACELLAETDRNIAVIAMDCGFANLSNFNRRFKELRKLRPREFRRKFHAEASPA